MDNNTSFSRKLYFIFLLSGITALIYQVAWQRLLTVYFGVDHIATTLIVSVFMLGLGLGALFGGYFIDKTEQRLKKYAFLECIIGIFGFVSIPYLQFIGESGAGSGFIVTCFFILAFLFFPTFFMGMTLPFLVRIIQDTHPDLLSTISTLYFVNTLGAALGALFTAYILFSFLGIDGAIYFAAIINICLAFLIFNISKSQMPEKKVRQDITESNTSLTPLKIPFFIAAIFVFITGFTALGYEIVWFRLLQIITKSSPYSFASTLFVYLLGIALGSYFMKKIIPRFPKAHNKSLFFLFQFVIAAFVLLSILFFFYGTKYTFFSYLPKTSFHILQHPAFSLQPIGYTTHYSSEIIAFFVSIYQNVDVFFWGFFFVFFPTLFMGASFPLLTSLTRNEERTTGSLIGNIYFFNIFGNVFGAIFTGFILLPHLKTTGTILLLSIPGLFFLLFTRKEHFFLFQNKAAYLFSLLKYGIFIFLLFFSLTLFPQNEDFYTLFHFQKNVTISHVEEGADAVIATFQKEGGSIENFINGLGHGSRPGYTTIAITLEELSYLQNNSSNLSILIIGFGTGTTVETVLKLDRFSSLTVVEISNSLIENLMKFNETRTIINDPRVHLIVADGRKYLYQSNETFDVVLMDPIRQITSHSTNIYSKEFFEIVKDHLTQEGIYALGNGGWGNGAELCLLPKTLLEQFPYIKSYDYFIVASNSPLTTSETAYDNLLQRFDSDMQDKITIKRKHKFIATEDFYNQMDFDVVSDHTPWLEFRLHSLLFDWARGISCSELFDKEEV